MPAHDWSRVTAGIFHHFHGAWIVALSDALNQGVLPSRYYALAEQSLGDAGPDVLALERRDLDDAPLAGGLALAVEKPKVQRIVAAENDAWLSRQKRLVIRHASDNRMVAVIEIVSHANKSNSNALRLFVRKSIEFLRRGIHLLIVDVQPPTRRDPHGIHGAIWAALGEAEYEAPPDKPLTLVSYTAGEIKTAYIEPAAVGDALADMPLFLDEEHYVRVPLEATGQVAWNRVPERWRGVVEP